VFTQMYIQLAARNKY